MATDGSVTALTSDIPELPELSRTQNHQKYILWAQLSALWRRNIVKGYSHQQFYESSRLFNGGMQAAIQRQLSLWLAKRIYSLQYG